MRKRFALGLAALVAAGCGEAGDGLPREPVSGAVELDGRPVDRGLITFRPAGGGEPIASAVIVDGAYTLPRDDGPVPGAHRVEIWSRQATGKTVRDRDDLESVVEETREAIPARYNLRSELSADVVAGGPNRFDFPLTSPKVAARPRR